MSAKWDYATVKGQNSRAVGGRSSDEPWSYGKQQAESIYELLSGIVWRCHLPSLAFSLRCGRAEVVWCRRKATMEQYHGYVCYEPVCRRAWLRRSCPQIMRCDGWNWADEEWKSHWVSWTMASQPPPFAWPEDAAGSKQCPIMSIKEIKSSVGVATVQLKAVASALSQLPSKS